MRSFSLALLALAGSVAGMPASAMPSYFRRQSTSPDNTCGNTGAGSDGYTCPSNLQCCSQYGYCGSTTAYCGDGCQPEFGTCETGGGGGGDDGGDDDDTDRCGPDFNNKSCAADECCSAAGWCGTSEDYCAAPDCLFLYGPACDANKVPSGTNTSTVARPLNGGVLYGGAGIYSCVNEGDVALTYDDGPGAYTSGLLDLLESYGAKATFFVSGDVNSRGSVDDTSLPWPALLQRMNSAGHQIASHTWSHADLSTLDAARRRNEMYKNEMALRNVLGFFPTYMRPPYSSCTAESGCESDLRALGYHIIYFDLDTQDYLNTEPSQIGNALGFFDDYFVGKNPDDDSALVIAHDIHEQSATTLSEHMLEKIKELGYTAVTVGECLGDPKANWYRSA